MSASIVDRDHSPISRAAIADSVRRFDAFRIVVVGDFFLDEYIEGEMFEISREGPIPVVRLESRASAAGAAGNLASSIRNLGGRVAVIGAIGSDSNGRALRDELDAKGIDTSRLIVREDHPTLTYSKIRARVESAPSREILRLDTLPRGPIPAAIESRVIEACREAAGWADGIIVLDQIGHLVTPGLLEELPALARSSGTFLQGSSREQLARLRGFDLVVPNDVETLEALELPPGHAFSAREAGEALRLQGRHRQVLLTLGPEGMQTIPAEGPGRRVATFAEEVVDVTGAGDAVASTAHLGALAGWDLTTIAWAASHAAAIAISRVGTHHVSREELLARVGATASP